MTGRQALSKVDKMYARQQYEDEKNSKQFGGNGRNNWIHGPPMTSMFPGLGYQPPEPKNVFRALCEGNPKWPDIKNKLLSKAYKFLKRARMPTQLKLQDRETNEPNWIVVGEEVDFYRNPTQETILVTGGL